MWSRRRFIFVGLAGTAAAGVMLLPALKARSAAVDARALIASNAAMVRAIASALLGPALPALASERSANLDRVTTAVAALIENLPPSTQREIGDLFGLLALKPARVLLGYSGDWSESEAPAIAAFLAALRDSSIGLKQQAYFALHDLVFGSFYAEQGSWAATGYSGPPKLA